MKAFKKIIVAVIICAILLSALQISVFADSENVRPMPVYREQQWHSPVGISEIKKDAEVLTFVTKVNSLPYNFYISAPNEGGIRFYSDIDGVFQPKGLSKLSYSEDLSGNLVVSAEDGSIVTLKKGESDWSIIIGRGDKELLNIKGSDISIGYRNGEADHIKISAPLHSDEKIYGTGERFNSVNQVGTKLQLWNLDAAYHAEDKNLETKVESYINVPFMHSTAGYSFFLNSAYCVDADFGVSDSSKYILESYGPKFDFYFWTKEPLENIQSYSALTGRSYLPPKWAFSYWAGATGHVWRASDNGKGEYISVLQSFLNGYKKLGIPSIAAIYTESPTMFDPVAYSMVRKNNTRMLMWTSGYFDYSLIREKLRVVDSELPVVRSSINNWWYNVKGADTVFLDHTHPNAKEFMKKYLEQYIKWGAKGLMVDMGEKITEDSLYYNGMSGKEMHNFSSYFYLKTVNEAVTELMKGKQDFVLFQRSGSAGSQSFGANFLGDNRGDMAGLKQQLNAGLSLSSSGFSIWGGDIGGFNKTDSPDTYMRWLMFSLFEPLMREHGVGTSNPWDFGSAAEEMFKKVYWLRENMLDTIYSAAANANAYGTPMVQPLSVAFPNEKELAAIEDEYMFCDNLLVCPVTENDVVTRRVTLPKGNWYSLWDGAKNEGGSSFDAEAPQTQIPVYLKAGAIMPLDIADTYKLSDSLEANDVVSSMLVTPADKKTSFEVWDDEAKSSLVYTNSKKNKNTFILSCSSKSNISSILAYGVLANAVKVDGLYLPKLSGNEDGKIGFYIDGRGKTVIKLPNKKWKNIEISGSGSSGSSDNLAANAVFTDSKNNKETKLLASLKDGNATYQWTASHLKGTYLNIALDKKYKVDSMLIKWGQGFANKYTVEVSTDGKEWKTVYETENGRGGTEEISFEPINAKLIRISGFKRSGNIPATMYNVAVYEHQASNSSLRSGVLFYALSAAAVTVTGGSITLLIICAVLVIASITLLSITAARKIKHKKHLK